MIDMSGVTGSSSSSSSSSNGTGGVLGGTAWVDGTVRRPVFQKASDLRNNSILSIKNNSHTNLSNTNGVSGTCSGFRPVSVAVAVSSSVPRTEVVDLMDDDDGAWMSSGVSSISQSKKRKLPVYI
jgi:hypothetical protein